MTWSPGSPDGARSRSCEQPMKLKGKVAVVTGGAKRIGREIAVALAARGCHVAITYNRSRAEAQAAVSKIRTHRVKAAAFQVDQRHFAAVRDAVREIHAEFGRIDILINNASSFYPTPWDRVTDLQWEDLLKTNLTGPWWFAQAVGPIMKRQKGGKIINMADVSVFSPWPDYLPYCVAKGGLVTLTKGLAKVLAPHVQVNAIAPGPILLPPDISAAEKKRVLDRTLLKRVGSPQDIVQAVLFFLEGSDFVTGVLLPVDGGRLLA